LESGDIAVATLRKPEVLAELAAKYPADRLLVLKVDVKNQDEIAAAFDKTRETFGRLDVVFNNAGYAVASEVESAMGHDDAVRDQFEVNFWGAVHVTQQAIKFFREVNKPGVGGHLLQLSSTSGFEGTPAAGFYSASKHALEGLSEALAREVSPAWNIKVTIIEPGPFRTAASVNFANIPPLPAYKETPAAFMREMFDNLKTATEIDDPRKAVRAFYKLTSLPEPPLHFPIGKMAIDAARRKATSLLAEADAYASWSEGLEFVDKST